MNTSWHSYPKVWALGHRQVKELFDGPVLVQEKIDGSQFSFGRFEGELKVRSKGATINATYPESMFAKAVEVVRGLDLHDGWTYRAEYLAKPKHNALAYDRVPKNHLILFDINTMEEEYLNQNALLAEAERIGLEVVPMLGLSIVNDPNALLVFLQNISILGGQKIEGVVIKNYEKFGEDKKVLMGKYVSEAFKEVHSKEWRVSNPSKSDVVQSITDGLRTPARWAKAVQHLREAGQITDSPADIGPILKEIHRDIEEECAEMIRDTLYKWAKSKILRGAAAGAPEWYKEQLLKRQFDSTVI